MHCAQTKPYGYQNLPGHMIVPIGADDCDVLIIDIDTADGRRLWKLQALENKRSVLIAYTALPVEERKSYLALQKPLRPTELTELLKQLARSKLATSKLSPEASRQEQSAITSSAQISPLIHGDNSINVLKNADTTKSLLQALLELQPGPVTVRRKKLEMIFDFQKLNYYCNQSGIVLKELLQRNSQDFVITAKVSANIYSFPVYDLIPVFTSVITTHHSAQLLPWLNSNGHFQLSRWPNFSALNLDSRYIKIAIFFKTTRPHYY